MNKEIYRNLTKFRNDPLMYKFYTTLYKWEKLQEEEKEIRKAVFFLKLEEQRKREAFNNEN